MVRVLGSSSSNRPNKRRNNFVYISYRIYYFFTTSVMTCESDVEESEVNSIAYVVGEFEFKSCRPSHLFR